MRTFLKRIISTIIVMTFVLCGFCALKYILIDDTTSYTRLMMHEFYDQDNIDILFLGPSQCYRGIIPSTVSELTGKSVFNASSSSQKPDASLAVIKEAIKLYDIQEIYLDISEFVAQNTGNYKNRNNMTSTYIVSDYMKPSINKTIFLLKASSSNHYVNSFIPAKRNWHSIFNFQYISSLIQKKKTNTYRNYEYDAINGNDSYYGNGFIGSNLIMSDEKQYTKLGSTPIDISSISDDWKKTITSIIDYCNSKDVKLTLFASPSSNLLLAAYGNYDDYVYFIKQFINDKNVEYVDFNLLKKEYLPYNPSNYMNAIHMNVYGAQEFSVVFSKYINGDIKDTAFYESVESKFADLNHEYYGVSYFDDEDVRHISLVSNVLNAFEYKVELKNSRQQVTLLQDYSTNNKLSISKELINYEDFDSIHLIISYRYINNSSEVKTIEYVLGSE